MKESYEYIGTLKVSPSVSPCNPRTLSQQTSPSTRQLSSLPKALQNVATNKPCSGPCSQYFLCCTCTCARARAYVWTYERQPPQDSLCHCYCMFEGKYASLTMKPKSKLISTRTALESNARLMGLTSKSLQSMVNFCADTIHYVLVIVPMVLLYVPLRVLS